MKKEKEKKIKRRYALQTATLPAPKPTKNLDTNITHPGCGKFPTNVSFYQ